MSRMSLAVAFMVSILVLSTQPLSNVLELNDNHPDVSSTLPGHYSDPTSENGQTACPPGTYQPYPNQTSCIDASPGHYVTNNSGQRVLMGDVGTISLYQYHTCAILDAGSVACWGSNEWGQLGDGTTTWRDTPTQTASLGIGRTAVKIAAGERHTCAILDNGKVACWGSNEWGQLGAGHTIDQYEPVQTASLGIGRTAVKIAAGEYHTCAILDNGKVACWGSNEWGQLGIGSTTDRNTPTVTASLGPGRTAVKIAAGDRHTCAILDNGSVSCWGFDAWHQLGDEETVVQRATPAQTASLGVGRTALAISAGIYHTCVVLDDGTVSCWGMNLHGQLGDGSTTDRNTPTQTASFGNGRTAVDVSAGGRYTCAILDDGTVSCWGRNSFGQLGDGSKTDRNTPTQTASFGNGRTAVAIAGGTYHACAILDNGSVSCWGNNGYLQLGGTFADSTIPNQVAEHLPFFSARVNTVPTPHIGQTTQTPCAPGTYQPLTGQSTCLFSEPGHYVPSNASALQTACAVGTYQPAAGQTGCLDSDPGYYVGSNASVSQTACAAGTYQPSSNSTKCLNADAGHYVPTTGQPHQTACDVGTYQPSDGRVTCRDAAPGYYVNQSASTIQNQCPEDFDNLQSRSTSLLGCYLDADSDGTPDIFDTDTDNDGVPNDLDACEGQDDTVDVDGDGTPDGCDLLIDSDNDGVSDSEDRCNGYYDNVDLDQDGTPDGCDSFIDTDSDGVPFRDDQCLGHDDNVDLDNDGTPDGCDNIIDSDLDGIADNDDRCNAHDDNFDFDGDFIPDGCDTWAMSESFQQDLIMKVGFSILILGVVIAGTSNRKDFP